MVPWGSKANKGAYQRRGCAVRTCSIRFVHSDLHEEKVEFIFSMSRKFAFCLKPNVRYKPIHRC